MWFYCFYNHPDTQSLHVKAMVVSLVAAENSRCRRDWGGIAYTGETGQVECEQLEKVSC